MTNSRNLRRTLAFAALALALAVSTVVLMADRADAHRAELSVSTSCLVDGRWSASWSITNSESGKVMDIVAEDVTDFAPNPTPRSGESTDTTTHANSVAAVTAVVTVDWTAHEPLDYSLTAFRPVSCQAPTTTTTTTPGTSTTLPPDIDTPATSERPATPVIAAPDFTG